MGAGRFLKKIHLKDHRFIQDCSIEFSIPDGNTPGSGINYIVGRSGSGKSKLLQTFIKGPNNPDPLSWKSNYRIDPQLYFIEIRDHLDEAISKRGADGAYQAHDLFPERLKIIHKDYLNDSEEYSTENLTGKLEKRLRAKNRLGEYFDKTFQNSGSGEARFNSIMFSINSFSQNAGSVAYIEEPETFLDPLTQAKLLSALAELAIRKQVFIITHSPYMMNWNYLDNGCTVIKTNKEGSYTSVGQFCDKEISRKVNHPGSRNPQLNGVESKNIFFSNKVFTVEGQEDVGVISKYLSGIAYDFTFFGYGAGGSGKIDNVLRLCQSLNIPQVVALFDNSPKTKNLEYFRCKKGFPSYLILMLDAEDIRDKIKNGVKVEGAFSYNDGTEEYSLKTDSLGRDFEEKINLALKHFS